MGGACCVITAHLSALPLWVRLMALAREGGELWKASRPLISSARSSRPYRREGGERHSGGGGGLGGAQGWGGGRGK